MKKILLLTMCCILLQRTLPAENGDPIKLLAVSLMSQTPVAKYASTAEDIKGVELAVEEINAQGGLLGHVVEIVPIQPGDTLGARSQVATILKEERVIGIIGSNTSGSSIAIASVLQEAKVPMISPISTNPKVTLAGDYIFRACFTDEFQGRVMAQFALETLGAKKAVILTKVGSEYSRELAKEFRNFFSKHGSIVWEEKYLAGELDYSEILTAVTKRNPDVVFLPGHGVDAGLVLKQAHSMGVRTVFLGGDGWGKGVFGVAGEEAVQGHYFTNHWHRDIDTPENRRFVEAYFKKYGEKMIAASAPLAYDATMILAHAVNEAQSLDGRAIRYRLAATRDFKGVTGSFTFDENGDPINKDAVILKYHEGDIVLERTIKP